MKANELMIGDWVISKKEDHMNELAQIDAIEEGQTCILLRQDNTDFFTDISKIEPIPLTPEILEKNGFECERNVGYVYEDGYTEITVIYDTWNHTLKFHYNYEVILKLTGFDDISVRDLQHAFKLFKIDKQIIV